MTTQQARNQVLEEAIEAVKEKGNWEMPIDMNAHIAYREAINNAIEAIKKLTQ